MPQAFICDAIRTPFGRYGGALSPVMLKYRAIEFGIYAVYPTRKFLLPKVRALGEFLSWKLAGADWIVAEKSPQGGR